MRATADPIQMEVDAVELPLITGGLPAADAVDEYAPEQQYCIFRTGRQRYCLAVLDVEEVVDWPPVTMLPLAPPFLMGIFNLRGSIVPIIDISIGEGRRPDLPPRRVVVARRGGEEGHDDLRLGIAADDVIGTYSTPEPLLIEEVPRELPHCCGMLRHASAPSAATGMPATPDRLAMVLDLRRLVEVFPVPAI